MLAARSALLLGLVTAAAAGATFQIQGTSLTVTSNHIQVSFTGADVTGITNQLTGESYLRNLATPRSSISIPCKRRQARSRLWALGR